MRNGKKNVVILRDLKQPLSFDRFNSVFKGRRKPIIEGGAHNHVFMFTDLMKTIDFQRP